MNRARVCLSAAFLSLVAAAPCLSEEARSPGGPRPPEELSQLEPMLGNWESTGTWRLTADADPVRWTAVSTVEKILDGHFVRETSRIDMGAEETPPLVMQGIIGWDGETKRFRQFAVSNMGFGGVSTLYVVGKGKYVGSYARSEMGSPAVEVGVTEYSEDGGSFRLERSVGGGKFFVSVEGTMKRGGKGCPEDAVVAGPLLPPPEELALFEKHVGKWTYKAKISPMRGVPMMEVDGKETLRVVAGGHAYHGVLTAESTPDVPKGFRGEFYQVWDPEESCYVSIDLDNYGAFTVSTGHRESENRMVYFTSGSVYGETSVSRTICGWNEDVSVMEFTVHRLAGTAEPEKSFEGRFVRAED